MADKEFLLFLIFVICPIYYMYIRVQDRIRQKREIKNIPIRDFEKKIIESINDMDGRDFECFVAFIYKELGYDVYLTKATNDGGKDLILKDSKYKYYVEIKRYKSDSLIGRPLIQKLVGSALADGVSNCIFLTTSDYHGTAKEYAKGCKNAYVELINLDGFMKMCKNTNRHRTLEYLGYADDSYLRA